MKTMRSLIAILLMIIVLGACSGNDNESAEGNASESGDGEDVKQEISLNTGSEPSSLDPAENTAVNSGWIMDHLYDGLYVRNQDGEVQEGVAEKVETSEDGKVYTFTIRDDAKWSNGSDLTAEDFKYSWERVLNPETGAKFAYYLYVIENAEAYNNGEADKDDVGIKALDEKTLEVTLESPTGFLESLMTIWTFYPVNKEVVEANENWAQEPDEFVTNGAFTMTDWEHDNKIIVEKNEEYYNKDDINLDKITFEMINDATTAFQLYKTGDLDFISSIPTDQLAAVQDDDEEYKEFPYYSTAMFIFNTKEEPMNNAKVRKALSMSIDRQSLVDNVGQTGETPARAMVPPGADTPEGDFREVGGDYIEEDYEEAKKLIEEAKEEEGWDSLPEITMLFSTSENNKRYAEAVQEMLKQNLDVTIKLANQEWNSYLDTLGRGDYQMGRMAWTGLYVDPAVNLEYYMGTSTNNRTGWINEEYDDLLEQAQVEQDEEKRFELLHDAEEILMEDSPFMPIYFLEKNYLTSTELEDVAYYVNRRPMFKWAKLTN